MRRYGVRVTGPGVSPIRSIRASASRPAVSGTEIASKARPVGSRTEAPGCFCHIRRAAPALPVAWSAQPGSAGCAPGAEHAVSPHEQTCTPSTTSVQVPGTTSQWRSSA